MYVCFTPITSSWKLCDNVSMCSCSIESHPDTEAAPGGDSDLSRMTLGVYMCREEAIVRAQNRWLRKRCQKCNDSVVQHRTVYHCLCCVVLYYEKCAKEIPSLPQERINANKEKTKSENDRYHWIHEAAKDPTNSIPTKDRANNTQKDITFRKAGEFGCIFDTYALSCDMCTDEKANTADRQAASEHFIHRRCDRNAQE